MSDVLATLGDALIRSEPRCQKVSRLPELTCVLEDDVHVAHWPRSLTAIEAAALERLAEQGVVDESAIVHVDRPETALRALASIPTGAARDRLCTDLGVLVPLFAQWTGQPTVRVELATVRVDACRKLHRDSVGLRLLCTYAGPGTHYLPQRAANVDALGSSDDDAIVANARVTPDLSALVRCGSGDVVVLKGETWPGNAGRGAIHRSPPIELEGRCRLVLKIDQMPPRSLHLQ